jgi:hypothetical protein
MIQLFLGHKNIQHTVKYAELAAERLKDFGRDESCHQHHITCWQGPRTVLSLHCTGKPLGSILHFRNTTPG